MRVPTLLSLAALLTNAIAITTTTVLTPVEQSPYYYLGCYPYTADVAIGAYDIPNIATGYNNGNPVDCQIGCDQQFHAPYVFMYGTYCYCQVREVEFDIHQPGGAPVDNSFCTTPCFVDPNAPCGTLSDADAGRYVTVYGNDHVVEYQHIGLIVNIIDTSKQRLSSGRVFGKYINIGAILGRCLYARTYHVHPRPSPDIIDSTWELEHLYNIEVFGSLLICPKPGHFENLDLFYEPKQHGSGFGFYNVYIYHNSEARNVHIHKNNRQHPTVFCEPPIVLRIVSFTQLQHNGFVGIAITDVFRYICRFSKSDIVRHYVGPVFKRLHLAGNHFPADQLFLDFNDDTDDGQYFSSTKRVDK
ncbi:hypothetical protein CGCA056_v009912 [Colletotrichum aenigma]|uniref:uncharacterized protein n=1 Tax=Colletotrichum aenigma TaxID=1215731 RepID=UPI001872F288|nr:uncharacterized protein CGCA056_v009912 [Colletotrichum aenigma]KAF5518599.1 hypothetical protein CGCA056_v009912 [Colletotrichum aenigma]